jgi:hypothetical protein
MNESRKLHYLILIIPLCCLGFVCHTKGQTLSDQATISLLTASPGEEIYTYFGHSALRVCDPQQAMDRIYNYGTFDFNTPNFIMKFTQGRLKYFLDIQTFSEFMFINKKSNRSVYEQLLNLTQTQCQQLFDYLENNYLPENRYYLYDFFFDNCSSRIRDAIIQFSKDSTNITFAQKSNNKSFRQLIDPYIKRDPWLDLGIDLGMGLPSDRRADPDEYMFLPDYLMTAFENATQTYQQASYPLVGNTKILFKTEERTKVNRFYLSPKLLFWSLFVFVLGVTLMGFKNNKLFSWLDLCIFGIAGILGFFLLFLWFGTDHKVTANNLNLLWANPVHIPVLCLFLIKKLSPLIKAYFYIIGTIMVLILLFWSISPQEFHIALIPIILILILRSFYIGYFK